MLLQLVLYDAHGQLCSIDRDIDILEHIWQGTDMVLMPMCDDKSLHLRYIVLQICDIRYHKVDPQHVILRKGKSAVHDNDTVVVLECRNVHTDLFQSAQWYDAQFSVILFFQILKHLHFLYVTSSLLPGIKRTAVIRAASLNRSFFFFHALSAQTKEF